MNTPLRSFLLICLYCAVSAQAATLSIQVNDSAGKPLADAIVAVDVDGAAHTVSTKTAQIEQRGQKFVPMVSVVQAGTTVSFPNNDKVKHHIYSFSPAKKFDQKLYSGVAATPQVFDKAGLVVLGCNIHDRMVAYVKVVDTAYFARTDANGAATIELPASGKASVSIWHYNMNAAPPEQALQLKGAMAPLTFRLALKAPIMEAN